ncbi:MAG: serine hydrolase domain-containing protein [Bacteroidales bacterium]
MASEIGMNSQALRTIVALLVLGAAQVTATPQSPPARQPTLPARLEAIRAAANLPALAGATFQSSGRPEAAAVGVRRLGDATAVTADDLWHIGSLTKSFTSTLVGVFIERGQLAWTSTLGELLGPEKAGKFAEVTLLDLLTHRAGLPANVSPIMRMALAQSTEPLPAQRKRVLDALLAGEPAAKPGERFLYSNAGYMLLGAVLEAKTGRQWEDLLRAEVLKPLALTSAGFGPPGNKDALTQPRGHRGQPGSLVAVEPGPGADNPAVLGPAGTLHMSVGDAARWGQEHLRGERGQNGLLRAATFLRLHQPPRPDADYACGWVVRRDGGRRVIWHNGSNTMWYIILAFDPDADRGVVLATNGGIGAAKPLDDAAMGWLKELASAASLRKQE